MTVQETNTSQYPVIVKPSGRFTVTNNATGATVFSQNVGGLTPLLTTLQPGQSVTTGATWNPTQVGTFNVTYEDAFATKGIQLAVASPASGTPPSSPVKNPSPVAANLTTASRGKNIFITLTLKNVSATAVTLPPASTSDGFSVLAGSTLIWHSPLISPAVKTRTLAPGASITVQAVWNGKPNQKVAAKLVSVYTIKASWGGYSASTSI
jgi:hypothetical protein